MYLQNINVILCLNLSRYISLICKNLPSVAQVLVILIQLNPLFYLVNNNNNLCKKLDETFMFLFLMV